MRKFHCECILKNWQNETCFISAIETFPDDFSKRSLLNSINSKRRSSKEIGEGDHNRLSKVSVSQSTEEDLNSQTDCWSNDISQRRLDNWIFSSEERKSSSVISSQEWRKMTWKHNWFVYCNTKLRSLFAQLLYFFLNKSINSCFVFMSTFVLLSTTEITIISFIILKNKSKRKIELFIDLSECFSTHFAWNSSTVVCFHIQKKKKHFDRNKNRFHVLFIHSFTSFQ